MKNRTAWLVAGVLAMAAASFAVVVSLGLQFFMVATPSMGQTAPVGTLIVTRPAPDYQVGDIVTYRLNDTHYTHRIVQIRADGKFTTKGDLNGAPDPLPVAADQIAGRAAWIAPGLGWLWKGLPWIVLGCLVVYALSLLRWFDRTWRWVIRISGWTLAFSLVAAWIRPWVSLARLSWTPVSSGGVNMHMVNTGLFPLDVLGNRLVSGQDAVVHVTEQNAEGYYTLSPGLAFHWWEQLALILACLIPLGLSFLVKAQPSEPYRAMMDSDPTGDAADFERPLSKQTDQDQRRHLILIGAIVVAVVASVSVVSLSTTGAAFTASIKNSANSAGTRTYFTCRQALTRTSGAVFAWPLDATNGRNEPALAGTQTGYHSRAISASNSTGCLRDTPQRSVSFSAATGSTRCLSMQPVSEGSTPTTFSIAAWFRTNTQPGGRIVGFSDAATGVAEDNYDRIVYLDKDGRVIFGVYPGSVRIVASDAGKDYADNSWHHVVATLSPAAGDTLGQRLYIDGRLAAGSTTSVTAAQSFSGFWKVGCGNLDNWRHATSTSNEFDGPKYFTGQLQYVAVYNRALSQAEVTEHFNAGVA